MWTTLECKKCYNSGTRHHSDYTDPKSVVVYIEPKTFWQKLYVKCILKKSKLPTCPKCGSANVRMTYEWDGK